MTVRVDMGVGPAGDPVAIDLEELLATRLLVQGNSGSGKSHLLRRLLERSAGQVQQVVIDPEGDFVTLADRYGHVPVEAADHSERDIARLAGRIREHRASVVLSLEGLEAEGQMRCAAAFLSALFEAPRGHWYPALVVVDEAQLFAPAGGGEVSEEVRRASLTAMTNLMCRGRKRGLAGVIATQRSGEPGYDNASFWIRGISTFAGARSPLVLIDGVERSLDNMDPAEIESFSILKDAAASAVYGVRGANGVIIINTKRGSIGKPAINIRMEQGVTQPVKIPDFLGAADYLEVLNSVARESGGQEPFSQERIDNIRNKVDPDLYPDVNWLDAITNDHASNSRVNLTVTGGNEMLRYAFVGSYYNENGIVSRDEAQSWNSSLKLRRYNMRTNIDLKVTPSTLMRVNLGGYLQEQNRPPQSIDDLFNKAFETPPYVHPTRYSSGEIPVTPERANPWALATQTGYQRFSSSKLESLFAIEQSLDAITEGLKANAKFSFDYYSGNSVDRSKSPDYYNPAIGRRPDGSLDLVIYKYGQQFLGYSTGSEWGNKSVYLEGSLNYTRNFGPHYVDALFLYNQAEL